MRKKHYLVEIEMPEAQGSGAIFAALEEFFEAKEKPHPIVIDVSRYHPIPDIGFPSMSRDTHERPPALDPKAFKNKSPDVVPDEIKDRAKYVVLSEQEFENHSLSFKKEDALDQGSKLTFATGKRYYVLKSEFRFERFEAPVRVTKLE